MTASQQHQSENFEYGPNGAMLPRSRNPSPTQRSAGSGPTMFYASTASTRAGGRIGGSSMGAYDIDNIVIPYSVAATTRVEILQCKEIPTPKYVYFYFIRKSCQYLLLLLRFEQMANVGRRAQQGRGIRHENADTRASKGRIESSKPQVT